MEKASFGVSRGASIMDASRKSKIENLPNLVESLKQYN